MHNSLLRTALLVGLASGCTGSGQFVYSGEATAPEMVVISPGVQVIADLDEPIFFSGNYYWRNQGGSWYRSQNHTHGWVRIDTAPVAISSIERPSAYVHYHGEAHAGVRDHREVVVAPEPRRDERREQRIEEKQERHDDKQERHEEKVQRKDERKDERKDDKHKH